MTDIPPLFLESMRNLLGRDFPAFRESLEQPAVAGLRTNTLKIDALALQSRLPYTLQRIPWSEAGFWIRGEWADAELPPPGRHPYHAAGFYYLQEPSAMLPVEILDPRPSERVLDLCAAPGGKSTHIAAMMENRGILVANEIHPRRVWELAENLERWGARNAIITHETPQRLAYHFETYFDKVLVDAPCSGEGMMRKSEAARAEWSPNLVLGCAQRQGNILQEAARMLRPGGKLVYSTCTFNPQENEMVIARLLRQHPEMKLEAIEQKPGLLPGRPDWVESGPEAGKLSKAVRIWPHHANAEGHFVALLSRSDAASTGSDIKAERREVFPGRQSPPSPPDLKSFEEFCHESLFLPLEGFDSGRLMKTNDQLYLLPEGVLKSGWESQPLKASRPLSVVRPGWWLGSFKSGRDHEQTRRSKRPARRFEPAHALALGSTSRSFRRVISYPPDAKELVSYLRGEVLHHAGENGWVIVAVEEYPLGWGKLVQGRVKNSYPKGLRQP